MREYPDTCADPQTWRELVRECDPVGLGFSLVFLGALLVTAIFALLGLL